MSGPKVPVLLMLTLPNSSRGHRWVLLLLLATHYVPMGTAMQETKPGLGVIKLSLKFRFLLDSLLTWALLFLLELPGCPSISFHPLVHPLGQELEFQLC